MANLTLLLLEFLLFFVLFFLDLFLFFLEPPPRLRTRRLSLSSLLVLLPVAWLGIDAGPGTRPPLLNLGRVSGVGVGDSELP